jgi:hypothetical protein
MTTRFPPGNVANKSQNIFLCEDRISPGDEPRDITNTKHLYLPFKTSNSSTHLRKNPFGAVIYKAQSKLGTFTMHLMESV